MTDASKEFFDVRDQILNKYGESRGDGRFTIPPENAESFSKEVGEYADIEHDVDVFQIDANEFASGNLDNQQMFALDWMVKPEG